MVKKVYAKIVQHQIVDSNKQNLLVCKWVTNRIDGSDTVCFETLEAVPGIFFFQ